MSWGFQDAIHREAIVREGLERFKLIGEDLDITIYVSPSGVHRPRIIVNNSWLDLEIDCYDRLDQQTMLARIHLHPLAGAVSCVDLDEIEDQKRADARRMIDQAFFE